jgi:hypothetical protein
MDDATSFRFSRIYVVESLRPGDRRTGTELYQDTLVPATWQFSWLSLRRFQPVNRADLFRCLKDIAIECRKDNAGPLLHFEAHGSEVGLELSSGETVCWADLWRPLAELNAMCRLNLFVVVSACCGASVFKTIVPTEPAPFWGLLGPRETIGPDELLQGFRTFYKHLFNGPGGREALFALNGNRDPNEWPFIFTEVHFAFRTICHHYLKAQAVPERESVRVEALVQQMVERERLAPEVIPRVRSFFTAAVADHSGALEKYRRRFFMIDIDESNDLRFPVNFDKLLDL